jgi:hypothetical protein
MPHKIIAMRRYTFDPGQTWQQRIIACATAYRQRTGQVPNLAHVSERHKEVPLSVGVVHIVKTWGLGLHEIDLGVM